ncbi:hypothetical protein OHB26_33135 [Nocardia sp. NBC_01503]|uniref:hypothetical protein n=1 Tax=Nocardia sp. NBC_01503 TaxID=2975997 RepID=UPI002E7BC51F|nr:hypothetical protein [Nocardia sp. NBC_01503]WTL31700.1 hypothetical protein OHB26_33135 [Nocardia sp. NBC_01503]
MNLRFLGRGGSDSGGCPSLYATDHDTYLVQGWETDRPGTVEIPHLLTGFAEPGTFLGSTLTDTGRGTFSVSGRPVIDPDVLELLTLADNETAIEVPKLERTFYGNAAAAQR